MSGSSPFSGTTEVRPAHRFDERRLTDWLAALDPQFAGSISVAQFKGGQSNPTYKITTASQVYVLRRKPPGKLLKGAHAVEREARVQQALATVGFPVPRLHGVCTDDSVIGTPFYLMDWIDGRIFWDVTLPEIAAAERRGYFDAMSAVLAQLHRIDYDAIGLGDFGRHGNYLQRQIQRWTLQYSSDEAAGRDPNMERLVEWLPNHIPPGDETALVHGDFRLDNVIFHSHEPRILAVLDWELSTLGHPLADFAYHLLMYRLPPLGLSGLAGADLPALGIPGEADYVADYCRRTGRRDIADLDFYLAFNLFRFAAIIHGIKGRLLRGNASSADASRLVEALPRIAQLGWEHALGR